jgi:phage tail sheath protein FI
VLGVYARSDAERGVFKAPANEILRGALDLEFDIDDNTQDNLNPKGVNVTRNFPGRGIRVWGARTIASNALWKYVSVRRLFIFLERSIYEGTQWVVFEPNDDRLWARVIDTIRLFLRAQWRLGALFGRTEQEAFFITCDRTTMTQDDILNGRLICEIGIAPVRPAEFVIFRIFQNTAEAQR